MNWFRKIVVSFLAAAIVFTALPVYASAATSSYKTTWKGTTYYHDPAMAAGKSILPGIDVSQYQGDINWSKVAADGIQFTFIRLGYTSQYDQSINLDPKFKANIAGAKDAGVKVGVYYRSQARTVSEAIKEANFTLEQLSGYSLELPIAVDYEYYSGGTVTSAYPDKATKTAALNAFCDTVSAAGYRAVIYLNTDILANDVNASGLNYGLWLARWTTGVPEYSGSYEFWQCCGGGANVDGISGAVDLDWWYTTATDIVKNTSGKWIYTVNGVPDYTYTGVAKNKNGWWYVENGIVNFSYTGFAKNNNGKWYVENGKVDFQVNSVLKDTTGAIGEKGAWYYVVDSKVQTGFTGLANYKNANGWWYIVNGKVDFTVNTVAKNKNGWWYVLDGKVRFGFTGLADYRNENGWWYIRDGKVDFNHNGVDRNKNGWWYVTDGKVQFGFTGLADYWNTNGWWYIQDGLVDFIHNGVDKNRNGWWYVTGGKVRFGFTGLADYRNENGWWYIRDGAVDFTHNGAEQNKNGWWYVKDGKVDFTYNGTVEVSGELCQVKDGRVIRESE